MAPNFLVDNPSKVSFWRVLFCEAKGVCPYLRMCNPAQVYIARFHTWTCAVMQGIWRSLCSKHTDILVLDEKKTWQVQTPVNIALDPIANGNF